MNKLKEKFKEVLLSAHEIGILYTNRNGIEEAMLKMALEESQIPTIVDELIKNMCDIRGCVNVLLPYDKDDPELKILRPCIYCGKEK